MMAVDVSLSVLYVTSFHGPLAEDSHITKPDVIVMGSILCPKDGPGREGST